MNRLDIRNFPYLRELKALAKKRRTTVTALVVEACAKFLGKVV